MCSPQLTVAMPRLLSPKAVAAFLGKHPNSVRRLIRQGRLAAYRIGNTGSELRIPAKAVRELLRRSLIGSRWLAESMRPR